MSIGGEGQTGYKYTEEHSKKLSDSLKESYKNGTRKPIFESLSKESVKKIREGASRWAKENTVGEKNPMWGKGKIIIIDGIEYNTMREASEYLGVHIKTIQYRLNSPNFEEYCRTSL
jgi:TPP-dependent indolepyruvate ferredoxin oxidoreductase alpha subunit